MTWKGVFELLTWSDLLDVLVVTVLFYNLILLIRGTRAVQMLTGIFLVAGIYYVSRLLDLRALEAIIESVLIFLPFAVIVLFQQEIRRALTNFGRNPLLHFVGRPRVESALGDVALAATTLASRRIGALIVFERSEGLRNFVENGIPIDALVSFDLLLNLFTPETPLHDGAVIVQGDRVAAAACFLPLTVNAFVSKDYGTRHRAGIGLTEETDAVAIIVSEETGTISLALAGQIERGLTVDELRARLRELISAVRPAPDRREARSVYD